MIRTVVVEDQTPAAQYLTTLLDGTSRVEVIGTATDGVEGLRLCAQLRPDAAFLDINLPGQDGISLATQLTKLTSPPRLVFTAENVERATDAFRLRAVDYLLKPLDPLQVAEAINRLLAQLRPFEFGSFPGSASRGGRVLTPNKTCFSGAAHELRQFQTFGIFAAGYLARPLGGVVMAHAGDLRGRKQMFTLSIFLMALPTLGIGLLPTYSKLGFWAPVLLLLLRILQGVAVGGEVPGAWVFVSEHVHPSHVGMACGILTAGLTGGILLGSLVAAGLSMVMTHGQLTAYGWRLPFLLGGAFGLLSMYLRRLLAETPVFEELKARRALAAETPLKAVLRDYRGAVVLSGLLTWMLSAAIVVVILMTPALLEKMYGVAAVVVLRANSLAALALTVGCVLAGRLTDRFGPGRVLLVGCPLLGAATYLLFAVATLDSWLTTFLYTLAGLTTGIVAVVPYVMITMFPPKIRFSGISFSYNLAYAIFGGLTPIVVAWLLRFDRLAPAHYVGTLCLLGTAIGVFLIVQGSTHKFERRSIV